jgi:hypothetical protein
MVKVLGMLFTNAHSLPLKNASSLEDFHKLLHCAHNNLHSGLERRILFKYILTGTVRRELGGVKVVSVDRYSFKDVPLDLRLSISTP